MMMMGFGLSLSDRLRCPEEEQPVTRLCTQGATDLEKQLELLLVENQHLKQELQRADRQVETPQTGRDPTDR
ncbi:hypothetical protein EYF80_050272 [Liparis tanakae]|uniref:Uncharacterized protein n=1 Tax=Liparis tanakae TaxID=230148 RepID=A0A4Z2FF31_9TELE|nr:hypothetical protein EYF80_050272 [Liparis tanakae]